MLTLIVNKREETYLAVLEVLVSVRETLLEGEDFLVQFVNLTLVNTVTSLTESSSFLLQFTCRVPGLVME